jgi:hypothetical protein
MNAKLPNELIHVILKLKYFNFRKEWLQQNLEFPKWEIGDDPLKLEAYKTTNITWCVYNLTIGTVIIMRFLKKYKYEWQVLGDQGYTIYSINNYPTSQRYWNGSKIFIEFDDTLPVT